MLILEDRTSFYFSPFRRQRFSLKEEHTVSNQLSLSLSPPPPQADNLNAAITASGCSVEAYWPTLFGGILTKAGVDMDAFFPQPGSGGGGGGGGAAAATEAVVEVEKEKEESEDMGGGGMGMFGDEDGGDGAY
jgi:ribosomal protein L12E/L44/L45/RPP1/RPP2